MKPRKKSNSQNSQNSQNRQNSQNSKNSKKSYSAFTDMSDSPLLIHKRFIRESGEQETVSLSTNYKAASRGPRVMGSSLATAPRRLLPETVTLFEKKRLIHNE